VRIKFLNDDGSQKTLAFDVSGEKKTHLSVVDSALKYDQAKDFLQAYNLDVKTVLVDSYNKNTLEKVAKIDVQTFAEVDFNVLLFTSGTTGEATGVFKKKSHLQSEVEALYALLKKHTIKQVVVTVPFIHIYGILFGILLPQKLGVEVIVKEHFMPNDIVDLCDEATMVVTTPLYVKSLVKLKHSKDISKTIFITSTAPLAANIAKEFIGYYGCKLYQFFGSTETGGIAYKEDAMSLWTPLESVKVTQNEDGLMQVDSPFVSNEAYDKNGVKTLRKPFETFDYIDMQKEGFELIGRDSKIIKIAGKRYSTIDIETVIEELDGVERAVVQNRFDKNSLRGESLLIYMQASKRYKNVEIKRYLKERLSNIQFELQLCYVDEIALSQTGKKLFLSDLQ
jgi:acyl-coenzyme A synthetase/AMP-(fatty) acid ligase